MRVTSPGLRSLKEKVTSEAKILVGGGRGRTEYQGSSAESNGAECSSVGKCAWLACTKPWAQAPALYKLGVVAHDSNASI